MKISNIHIGKEVVVDPSSSINNVRIADRVKVSKNCSIYGSELHQLEIGHDTYVGMFTIINGFAAKVRIGSHVSIAQQVNIMADSGPNASKVMQKYFPIQKGEVSIGDHSWIGTNAVIMPGVSLGEFCVVAANSFVNQSFSAYSVIGGNPARLIRKLEKPS